MVLDFETSTYNSINEFNKYFAEVRKKYQNMTMPMVREYFKNGTKIVGVPEELYNDLDRLFAIRTNAIETEMVHIQAQAKKAGVKLPESIVTGRSLKPFFEDNAYEKIPTLRVFEYMALYNVEEIAQMKGKLEGKEEQSGKDSKLDERA